MASSSSSFTLEIVENGGALSKIKPQSVAKKSGGASRFYDVFINHRGPDCKHTLALQLYRSIEKMGFRPFLDSREMELGDSISTTLESAICSALVHIAIFSRRYAESAWCLAELVLMLQSGAKIIPVFYDVAPYDLRYIENGVYAEAFNTYKEKGRYLNQLEEWKSVLRSVSLISGFECNEHNKDRLSEAIMSAVLKEVKRVTPLDVAKHAVGLDEIVDDFERNCERNKEENSFHIIGIFGKGGSGKTTLAKEFFNRKRSEYDGSCFLFDVREAAVKDELPWLQIKLLKDLFMEDRRKFLSTDEGISYLRYRLTKALSLRFLIVIDDIDHISQLDALLVTDRLNPDSLVIVTTRSEEMLVRNSIAYRYRMKEMNEKHSSELFCWHAFQQPYPFRGFEGLVESFVDGCRGLPLSLQVLGSLVSGTTNLSYWQAQLHNVCKTPGDIRQTLKISYDSLDREEKELFMDVACFFIGKLKSIATKVWEGSGWKAERALQTLKDKCLVFEVEAEMIYSEDKWLIMNKPDAALGMHDHIRDFGREMADAQRHPCRLWSSQDLRSMELKGFKNILSETNNHCFRCFHSFFDSSVGGRIAFFLGNSEDCAETSTRLLSLEIYLRENPLISIPSWIPVQKLQRLRIVFGCLQRLWYDNLQVPFQLKELVLQQVSLEDISSSLEMLNELQDLVIKGKSGGGSCLVTTGRSISETLRKLSKLKGIILCHFRLIGKVCLKNSEESAGFDFPSSNLQGIQIDEKQLECHVSISGEHCPNLESLHLESMENLNEVGLISLTRLNSLKFRYCGELKKISRSFGMIVKPATLDITECWQLGLIAYSRKVKTITAQFDKELSDLKTFHQRIFEEDLSCFERTIINGCSNLRDMNAIQLEALKSLHLLGSREGLSKLSICTDDCPHLESVCLESMENLIEVDLTCITALKILKLKSCLKLKKIFGSLNGFTMLTALEIEQCPQLMQFPSLADLSCAERVVVDGCSNLQIIDGIEKSKGLKSLHLSGTGHVSKLSISGQRWPNLESIHLESLEILAEVDVVCVTALKSLIVRSCTRLITITGSVRMAEKLATLELKECPYLMLLPSLAGLSSLERVIVNRCPNLQIIDGIEKLEGLKSLHISQSGGAVSKISIAGNRCPNLEFVHLESMGNLIEVDLRCVIGLKILILKTCPRLITVFGSLDSATNLAVLEIEECPQLIQFPSLAGLSCMERVIIDKCPELQTIDGIEKSEGLKSLHLSHTGVVSKLSISGQCCPNLEYIHLESMKILDEVDLISVTALKSLTVRSCTRLITISGSIHMAKQLVTLELKECPYLMLFPNVEGLCCLERITIDRCENLQIIDGFEKLEGLKSLHLSGTTAVPKLSISGERCPNLESVHLESVEFLEEVHLMCVTALESLTLQSCRRLTTISGSIHTAEKLATLEVKECPYLMLFPSLGGLSCLERVIIDRCSNLQILDGFEKLEGLKSLHISGSGGRMRVLSISGERCPNLESIHLESVEFLKVRLMWVTALKSLTLQSCRRLTTISGSIPEKLATLEVKECQSLMLFPNLAGLHCMKRILVDRCPNLQIIDGIKELEGLEFLHISGSEEGGIVSLGCYNLESLHLELMQNLIEVDLTRVRQLMSLTLESCRSLTKVSGSFCRAEQISTVIIKKCPELMQSPFLAGLRNSTVIINGCPHLLRNRR